MELQQRILLVPVGPGNVVLLALVYGEAFLAQKIFRLKRSGGQPRLA